MARIHFVVKEPDKARYQNQARREQKSLGRLAEGSGRGEARGRNQIRTIHA